MLKNGYFIGFLVIYNTNRYNFVLISYVNKKNKQRREKTVNEIANKFLEFIGKDYLDYRTICEISNHDIIFCMNYFL